jgi:PIN domain nuclease of toxin-antitoxin system
MDLLLDTHTLLWFFSGDPKLSETAKQVIIEGQNNKFVSIGSVWEVAIKISLKKLFFDGNTMEMLNLIDVFSFTKTVSSGGPVLRAGGPVTAE